MKLSFCLDEKPALSGSGSLIKITVRPRLWSQKPASIMLSQIYSVLWRETSDVQPTRLQIFCWIFINPPHFRYQSSYAGVKICFHLVNTKRRIFKPPFDQDISHAGYATGRPAFVSPKTLCCKWETLHAEPVGLHEAGSLAAPLLPSSHHLLMSCFSSLKFCQFVLYRQEDRVGPQQL